MWISKLTKSMSSGRRKWFGRRNSGKPQGIEPGNQMTSREVIWDAADKRSFPSNRRGFAVSIAIAMLGLPSLAAARAAQRHLLKRSSKLKFAAVNCAAGQRHSDASGKHIDLSGPNNTHADGTPHNDSCVPSG
jgi:hypothetical protein